MSNEAEQEIIEPQGDRAVSAKRATRNIVPHVEPAAPATESAAIISMIERAARDPAVDIEKFDRLMQWRERVETQSAKVAFASALAEMQAELPVIGRRGKIEVRKKDSAGERTGAIQQSTAYALWEDINEGIKPFLAKHRFALSFRTGLAPDGRITVTGILSHAEGHQEETTMTLTHDSTGSKNAVQAVGSSISYGKRYTATALLNLTSRGEDDDGQAAGIGETITDEQHATLVKLAAEVNADLPKFLKFLSTKLRADIKGIEAIPAGGFDLAFSALEGKRAKS